MYKPIMSKKILQQLFLLNVINFDADIEKEECANRDRDIDTETTVSVVRFGILDFHTQNFLSIEKKMHEI